jgi:hypothetical protein
MQADRASIAYSLLLEPGGAPPGASSAREDPRARHHALLTVKTCRAGAPGDALEQRTVPDPVQHNDALT